MTHRIGVVGGGQLGRMLGLAGVPLGMEFTFLDPAETSPASAVGRVIRAEYADRAGLDQLAAASDVVTYEFENVPVDAARRVAAMGPVRPAPAALQVSQDRLLEKQLFEGLGIPTPRYAPATGAGDLGPALDAVGLPAVLKTRRLGYDGKGQRVVRTAAEAERAAAELSPAPLIVESLVDFRAEAAMIAVRGIGGDTAFYPLVRTHHRGGILCRSEAPADLFGLTPAHHAAAEGHARRIMDHLGYAGVLAVEFFITDDGLVANEIAPRVHNSGHWTIEGAETSQFENHLRAITGLPLGSTSARGCAVMLNIIGTGPDAAAVLAVPGAHLHLYGKSPRPGRKLGHVTVRADTPEAARDAAGRLSAFAPIR